MPPFAEKSETQVEQGKPGEFCAPMVGLQNGCALSVAAYPASWRVEVVNDDADRGPECVRSERVVTSSGIAHIRSTLAFTGELRRWFGTQKAKRMSPQWLDIE